MIILKCLLFRLSSFQKKKENLEVVTFHYLFGFLMLHAFQWVLIDWYNNTSLSLVFFDRFVAVLDTIYFIFLSFSSSVHIGVFIRCNCCWLILLTCFDLCCVFGSFFEFFINLLIMFLISSSFPIFFVVISKFLNECFIGVCFALCCVPIYLCYWLKHAIPRWCSFLCLIIL